MDSARASAHMPSQRPDSSSTSAANDAVFPFLGIIFQLAVSHSVPPAPLRRGKRAGSKPRAYSRNQTGRGWLSLVARRCHVGQAATISTVSLCFF